MDEGEFEGVLNELLAIRKKKRADYSRSYIDPEGTGLANLLKQGWEGVVVRLQDKMDRLNGFALQSIIEGEAHASNEPVEDAFTDAAVYSILGLILYRRGVSWRKDSPRARKSKEFVNPVNTEIHPAMQAYSRGRRK